MNSKKIVVVGIAVVAAAIALRLTVGSWNSSKFSYTQFLNQVRSGKVESVSVGGGVPLSFKLKDGTTGHTTLPNDYRDAIKAMLEQSVSIGVQESSAQQVLANSIPFLALLAMWCFFMWRGAPCLRGRKGL